MAVKPLILTSGEPAGIGPDLCISLATRPASTLPPLVIAADHRVLESRADLLGTALRIEPWQEGGKACCGDGLLTVIDIPTAHTVNPGKLDVSNADAVMTMLNTAIDGCLAGTFSAMVTGPVQKSLINEAGLVFTGHTEYLADRSGCEQVVMMLASDDLRVALATTHLPLSAVPAAITPELLQCVLEVLDHDLKHHFGIARPRILVCGLNPHAGENGHLGREEIEIINPVLASLKTRGMDLSGPLPADTLFTPRHLQHADAVLAMYHDQGLPVLKFQGFGSAVNITLGLPFIRTSVDHGTALDLAGSGRADSGSLLAAVNYAARMATATQPGGKGT